MIDLHAPDRIKVKFLESRGYVLREVSVQMTHRTYRHLIPKKCVTVIGVFNSDDTPFCKPHITNLGEEWLMAAFTGELTRIIYESIKELKDES